MDDHNEYRIVFAGEDMDFQYKVVQLLGRCFPDYWEQRAMHSGKFPFRELSFVALDHQEKVQGHVGLLPFEVFGEDGACLKLAGVASVAVAPECRGRGLAASLCRAAAEWAVSEGYCALPLFTSLAHVYASVGWADYPIAGSCCLQAPEQSEKNLQSFRCGSELSMAEQTRIREFYNAAPAFPGKVVRKNGFDFHDWPRIFRDKDIRFQLSDNGYALFQDGTLAECYGAPGCISELLKGCGKSLNIAFPAEHPLVRKLLQAGWKAEEGKTPDVWHGEHVMNRNAVGSLPPGIAFPLADKF